MRFSSFAVLAMLAAAPSMATAQQKEPKRPKLDAQADTNDSRTYYRWAMDRLRDDPGKAADALYWSTRLEPTWADALYARRVALLLADPSRLSRYWAGDRRTIESKEIRQIDSLFYRALTLNPFVSQVLDRQLYEAIADDIAKRYERSGAGTANEVRYYIDQSTRTWGPSFRAWLAYGDGRYADALLSYAQAIKENSKNGPLRVDRARVFVAMGQLDSALADLSLAVEDMRKRDTKDLIFVYQSKALTEHSIAVVHQQLGRLDAAREAYGRAIQEDLSYYPAHLQLAYLALDAKDTTSALSEMDLAVQLRADDAAAQYMYGFTLALTGKNAEAESTLRKAIALNPVYSLPYFSLAQVLEKTGHSADAAAEYRSFLARAARQDPRRPEATTRLAALGGASEQDR